MTELLESGKAECALLIEERRRKPGDLFTREVSASRLGGGRFTRDGTHAPEKLKTMVPYVGNCTGNRDNECHGDISTTTA